MGDLAVSRAFGDARFKISSNNTGADRTSLGLQRVTSSNDGLLKTPPYITAEPIITTYTNIKKGDFLILGTDGIWDFLSNEDAVALIGRWSDTNLHEQDDSHSPVVQKTKLTESQEETFVFEDENAAVHIIRNGLGGVRKGRLLFNLSLPPGKNAAKKYRDDITVMVIFFDP